MDTTSLEPAILDKIDELRRENNACTMKSVAGQLRISETGCRNILGRLLERGLVSWTAMPGSLMTTRSLSSYVVTVPVDVTSSTRLPPPPPPAPAAERADKLVEMQAEINRLLKLLAERDARDAANPSSAGSSRGSGQPAGKNRGKLAAERRAQREPTAKELAARAALGQLSRDRAAARQAAAAAAEESGPGDGDQQPADADGHDESVTVTHSPAAPPST